MWAAVTETELAAIENAQWRSWPARVQLRATRVHDEAVAHAKRFVREHGTGNVVQLDVREQLISNHAQGDVLSFDVSALNHALVSAIIVDAEYVGPITDFQIREAEAALKLKFPAPWRNYVQAAAWFRRGFMRTGAYVWLYPPPETVECMRAWGDIANDRPGMVVIGGNGAGEMLTLDARAPNSSVTLTPMISSGWEDSIEQAASIDVFAAAIENGSFDFVFSNEP